ncbi:MAG: GNAT family N-acetyltransferase [Candidatus Omnitrophica bacterium]|nr:GNAT family N-acetyltransferase [Candidatus Omnitrophota bacterium]
MSGERIILRPLTVRDLDGPYRDWLNDYEVTRFLETGSFPTTPESLRRYYEQVAANPDNVLLAITDRRSGAHVGNIKLGPIHPIHRRADMGIMVGDKRVWGLGYGGEAIALILDYAFRRLNLHKITLGVHADHAAAVRLYQRLGFVIEGTLKEQLFRDGVFHDKYVMGILRADWERRRA